jgi:SAP domain-containing new25/Domain of unknown function (DUF6434)
MNSKDNPRRKRVNRPELTPRTSVDDFRNHYWYLHEVVAFCRKHGLPIHGQKLDLMGRIESFLATGYRAPAAASPRALSERGVRPDRLAVDAPVTAAFKCDDRTRAFFKSVIGDHFHFTAHVQQFRRDRQRRGARVTYGDLVKEWLAEQERRKDKNYKSTLQKTWEYNGFVREFLSDKQRNAGKGITDAAKAWNLVRAHCGPRNYASYLTLTAR